MKQRRLAPNIPLPQFRQGAAQSPADEDGKPAEPAAAISISTREPVEDAPGRSLQMIPVALIDPNPYAPREIYTPQMILERAEDLRQQGQHDPIHVIPNPEAPGRYVIADGWTRVQACIAHQVVDALRGEVHYELTLQQAAWFGYEQNEGRTQHCDLDRAMFYERLIAAGESPSEIARRAKLNKSMMTFYRAYSKLPDDVLEIVRGAPQKFGALVAYNLAKLYEKCGLRKTIALAGKFAAEDQPVRWLVNQVQSQLNPGAHKGAAPLKHVRYVNGHYKQRGDAFEVFIRDIPAEKRDLFAQKLEELLDTVAILAPSSENLQLPLGGDAPESESGNES